jgi:2-dehydro-3-deoxygluconokinase
MQPDIVAIGEPMVEFNHQAGRSYLQGFGGDTSNFAIAAARQGARVGVFTGLGDDAYGRMFMDLWRDEGVDASRVRIDPAAFTAVYFVTHDEKGHAFSFLRAGSAASRVAPVDLPADYIAGAGALHFSGVSLAISTSACDACFAAADIARSAGRLVSFDTNLRLKLWPKQRARAVILEAMALSDICLPSYDDMTELTGVEDPDALVDLALGKGARIVALKRGASGTIVADARVRHRIAPYPVTPVDATGAGDTFGGAFVARLRAGDDLLAAGRYAAVAAALSTTGYGAVAPIPDAARVRAALAAWGA